MDFHGYFHGRMCDEDHSVRVLLPPWSVPEERVQQPRFYHRRCRVNVNVYWLMVDEKLLKGYMFDFEANVTRWRFSQSLHFHPEIRVM